MDCPTTASLWIDFLDGKLSVDQAQKLEEHLRSCASCRLSHQELQQTIQGLVHLPEEEPGPELRVEFTAMLEREKAILASQPLVKAKVVRTWPWKKISSVAAVLLLVSIAYWLGKYNTKQSFNAESISPIESSNPAELQTLELLKNDLASTRLVALHRSQDLAKPSTVLLDALIDKLNFDEHLNVRMAAAEALAHFPQESKARTALIQALQEAEDPSLQIELIHLLVYLNEKKAIPVMKNLLVNKTLPDYVIEQVKIGLPQII